MEYLLKNSKTNTARHLLGLTLERPARHRRMDADISAAVGRVLGASEASSNRSTSSVISGQGGTDKADTAS